MTPEQLRVKIATGQVPEVEKTHYINNHIHTTHSFSPYTPTDAVYAAYMNGLATAGIMDHDTTNGCREFIEAAGYIGLPVTCGIECRVDFSMTKLCGRRLNNPDQISVGYCAMHGIPHSNIEAVDDFFKPYRLARGQRNRKMTENINKIIAPSGIVLDYDKDIAVYSTSSVTERHIIYGLVKKLIERYPQPADLIAFMKNVMQIPVSAKAEANLLCGLDNLTFYEYDILGVLKGNLVEKFYVDATDELPKLPAYIEMVHKFGGIAAYAYLGDVGDSVTGDKKTQKFEDDYLDLLFDELKAYGFDAVTFMPTRNTPAQLERIMNYCKKYHFFQISGEDINSPRQKFICPAYDKPEFAHLIDAAYTLIKYENLADKDIVSAKKLIVV